MRWIVTLVKITKLRREMNFNMSGDILDIFRQMNEQQPKDRQITIVDGSQFEDPELDEEGNIVVRDIHGNIVTP